MGEGVGDEKGVKLVSRLEFRNEGANMPIYRIL